MKQIRKRYTHEFKDMIVAQLKNWARIIDLARLYDISDKTIQQWKSDTLK
ncbi:MAG: transposase [Brevinema sp.]